MTGFIRVSTYYLLDGFSVLISMNFVVLATEFDVISLTRPNEFSVFFMLFSNGSRSNVQIEILLHVPYVSYIGNY